MIWISVLFMVAQPDMSNINIPYQAIPAFSAYSQCVGDHFANNARRDSADPDEVRQANSEAVLACREMRAEQLARGIAAVGDARAPLDRRTYRNRGEAQAAVRDAFDRFDRDFQVEETSAGNSDDQN